jgi:hypothetical protein
LVVWFWCFNKNMEGELLCTISECNHILLDVLVLWRVDYEIPCWTWLPCWQSCPCRWFW